MTPVDHTVMTKLRLNDYERALLRKAVAQMAYASVHAAIKFPPGSDEREDEADIAKKYRDLERRLMPR